MATRVIHSHTAPDGLAVGTYRLVLASDVEEGYRHFNPRALELKPRQKVGFSA